MSLFHLGLLIGVALGILVGAMAVGVWHIYLEEKRRRDVLVNMPEMGEHGPIRGQTLTGTGFKGVVTQGAIKKRGG